MKRKNTGAPARGFAQFIVKYRWLVIAAFVIGLAVSIYTMTINEIEYNLTEYLPEDSISTKALQIMRDEFDDKGMLYVMIEDMNTEEEIADIQKRISDIDGVASVILDPTTGIKDNRILLTVMFDDYDATDGAFETTQALIDALSDKSSHITGQSAFTYFTRKETEDSILKLGIVIVVIIIVMLIFTSRTFFELVPMIIVFGISIAFNMGTNYWFGGISYVSNLVALVLQLALSIDYSVILLHRFMEEKQNGLSAKDAAVTALSKGVSEILSSSFTTIAGLASLLLMTLPIGVEIGLSLAKSIVCSLIAVIFLMPALLVVFDKPLEKTKHKSFIPNITKPARAVVKGRKVIVPLFLIIVVLSGTGQFFNTYAFNMNGGSYIEEGRDAIQPYFGTMNDFVVIVPNGDYKKERALTKAIEEYDIIDSAMSLSVLGPQFGLDFYLTDDFTPQELEDKIADMLKGAGDAIPGSPETIIGFVNNMIDKCAEYLYPEGVPEDARLSVLDLLRFAMQDKYYSMILNLALGDNAKMLDQLKQLESENYSRLRFNIDAPVESEETFAFIADVKKTIAECGYGDEFYIMGESVVCYEMAEFFPRDNMLVSICIIVFILVILLAMFRNVALPFVLILAIQGGIWINFVIPFLAGNAVSFIGYLIISAAQMGATIDYAIVLTNRYRALKPLYPDRLDAMAAAENAVFPTILTSGVILTVTGFAMGIATTGVTSGMGMLLGIGTLIAIFVVLFVLPSLLLVCEGITSRADFSSVFRRKKKKQNTDDEQ